jgi:Ti-type conjugative transfer relaxase TraA
MAIYHLSAKIISRKAGQSVVASAAYRSASEIHDERLGLNFDFTRKRGVEHTEIVAPAGAPAWVLDRSKLWNAVEGAEKRKDAQLAREIELALPVELKRDEQLALLRDFVQQQFVSKGMVADFAIHRDNPENPHAHVLLTLRALTPEGFGAKERAWNDRSELMSWRAGWEEVTNAHLAQAGLSVRIDHRTLKAQHLELTPGRKIGISRARQAEEDLPPRIAERVGEQREIARENGERILADPSLALRSLTHMQATFTEQDIAKFLHTRTDGAEQFGATYLKVTTSPELVPLGHDERGRRRYTSREMLAIEKAMLTDAERLTRCRGHGIGESRQQAVLSQHGLSTEQRAAYEALTGEGDLKALVGLAGSGKSRLLAATREAWEAEGYTVKGAALSGIAAENLELASGIGSRTIASREYAWAADRDPLTSKDILVIDEAGMVGTRQLARVLEAAEAARAKVILVGDPEQLQAIEAGAAFRGILAETGHAELTEVHRQTSDWQREATQQLATGATAQALATYECEGRVVQLPTRDAARSALIDRWAHDGEEDPKRSRMMLAYTRDDVRELNVLARALRSERGELGRAEVIETERGTKEFAVGDRLYFLRNEKSLGVKNGSLGTIEDLKGGILQVKLDNTDTRLAVDTRFYRDLDYGYAATVYKAQGATVDRTYVLATYHYDRHSAYVALSRHRESATVFYGMEDFGSPYSDFVSPAQAQDRLFKVLSRARQKELAHDYLDREAEQGAQRSRSHSPDDITFESIEAARKQAAQRWLDRHEEQALNPSADAAFERSRHHSHGHSRDGAGEEFDM